MNIKTVLIGVVAIVIIVTGGYFFYTNVMNQPLEEVGTGEQVQVQDVTVGEGAQAVPGSVVSILYEGKLEDGTIFDSSAAHGNEPLVFTLGVQGIIPGFQIGINGMREGGERVMVIPPSLGYGAQEVRDPGGNIVIPANAALIFNVKLLTVEEATTTSTVVPTAE